eukprot:c34401_g1_i1.p1 GENE.c34401_g1_i1~~c34401_g1_i1.p1  ORF type:complete len:276 (+),score=99.08 c34401_g1_i1:32-859(+)
MSFFKDFGKSSKDLLSKEFKADEHTFSVESSTDDVNFKTELFSRGKGKIQTSFKIPNKGNFEVECETNDKVTAILKLQEFVPRALLTTKASTSHNFFFGVEYKHELGNLTGDLDYSPTTGSNLFASALVSRNNFLFGGNVKLSPDSGNLRNYSAGLGYSQSGKYEVTGTYSADFEKSGLPEVQLRFIHLVNPQLSYAASVSQSLSEKAQPRCELGSTYQLNSSTKVGAKITSAAQLGFFSLHKLNANTTLTQSVSLDKTESGVAQQFGLSFKLKY